MTCKGVAKAMVTSNFCVKYYSINCAKFILYDD
jgi:hypothetical protein